MDTSPKRADLFFSDMQLLFQPKCNLCASGFVDKWRTVPYQTTDYSGTMLVCNGGKPEDVTFVPALSGWYKIYLSAPGGSVLSLKLSGDAHFLSAATATKDIRIMEEFLWRCADMTGQSIVLTKAVEALPRHSMLAAIRFVPMSEQEVALLHADACRTGTKRIYATNDMHCRLYAAQMQKYEDWHPVVLGYSSSDVEWLSLEQIRSFVSNALPTNDLDRFCFPRPGDRNVQESFPRFDYDRVLRECVEIGHREGLLMSISLRMGAWGMGYPGDQYYFDCAFMQDHPEFRTIDRNGDEISAMSYAYPEVRKYMVDELVNMARSGCDAVTLIAHRGIPYVLFEKPVADRFFALYGEYPYELPLDEPRLHQLHCQIMTEFFQETRQALDDTFGKGKVQIHLRTLFSPYDSSVVGLDTEQLAREGLVDAIISYPLRIYEELGGDIWQPDKEYRIDLKKYTDYVRQTHEPITYRGDFDFKEPYKNYRGDFCGPISQQARVQEWMRLEKDYGVKIYLELLPRWMAPAEYRRRALELYSCGAERIALWDTYTRLPVKAEWNIASKLGHKDELASMDTGEGQFYRRTKICRLAGYDISRYNPSWGG